MKVAEFLLIAKSIKDTSKTLVGTAIVVEGECMDNGGVCRDVSPQIVFVVILLQIDLECLCLARAHVVTDQIECTLLNLCEDRSWDNLVIVAILHELDVRMLL